VVRRSSTTLRRGDVLGDLLEHAVAVVAGQHVHPRRARDGRIRLGFGDARHRDLHLASQQPANLIGSGPMT